MLADVSRQKVPRLLAFWTCFGAMTNNSEWQIGGRGEIRTHERVAPLAVFKTAALNHSATRPLLRFQELRRYREPTTVATRSAADQFEPNCIRVLTGW
jgi:hypothetical protein